MRSIPVTLLCAASISTLSGCDRAKKNGSVSVALDDGNRGAAGEVRIDMPGFQGSFKLPRIRLGTSDLDLDGLKLYPGSTVHGVDMNAAGTAQRVRVGFRSPGDPKTVAEWFIRQSERSGATLRVEGASVIGTTADRKPVRIDLAPSGTTTRGMLRIGA